MPGQPVINQKHVRLRQDNGTEVTATYLQAEDTPGTRTRGLTIRVRMQAEVLSSTATVTPTIQFRLDVGDGMGYGAWNLVTATSGIRIFVSGNYSDHDATTAQL